MTYTFNTSWIQDYESSWCTHEKFKFSNEITGSEYIKLLGIPDKSSSNNSLKTSLSALDKLQRKTGIFFNNIHLTYLQLMFGPLYELNDLDKFFSTELHFCPICLASGYHSFYHQLLFNKYCPFHDHKLETFYRSIQTDVTKRKSDFGFDFIFNRLNKNYSIVELMKKWGEPSNISLQRNGDYTTDINQLLMCFFPLSLKNRDKYIHLFLTKATAFNHTMKLTSKDFLKDGCLIQEHQIVTIEKDKDIRCILDQVYTGIFKYISNQLLQQIPNVLNILESLYCSSPSSRRLKLIELLKNGSLTAEICAYILWARDICGYKAYYYVGNIAITEEVLCNSVFYQYMVYEYGRYRDAYSDMPSGVFVSIIQHNLLQIFLSQYNTYLHQYYWLLEVEEINSIDIINLNRILMAEMPLVVIWKCPETTKYYMLEF